MKNDKRCFTPGRILVASLLGGLPAGLYLYRHNAYLFNKEKEGNQVFYIGIVITLIGIGIAILGNGPFLNQLARAFGPVSVILPFIVTRQTQAKDLQRHLEAGGEKASYAKAAAAGLISLAAVAAVGVLLAMGCSAKEPAREIVAGHKLAILERDGHCVLIAGSQNINLQPQPPCFFIYDETGRIQAHNKGDTASTALVLIGGTPDHRDPVPENVGPCGTEIEAIALTADGVRAVTHLGRGSRVCARQGGVDAKYFQIFDVKG